MTPCPSLTPGMKIMWDGRACVVLGFDGPCVQLRTSTGERAAVLLAALVVDPGFAVLVDGYDQWTCPGLVDTLSLEGPEPQRGVHSAKVAPAISAAVPRGSRSSGSGVW